MKSSTKDRIKEFFPASVVTGAQDIAYAFVDLRDAVLGRRDPLIPPTRLMFDGPRSVRAFRENGLQFLRYYKEVGGLKPHEKILDVGSGIGREAVPLIGYMSPEGSYDGFDINKVGVEWCRENISSRHPNFRFQLMDVYNKLYNPNGKQKASEFVFPFPDASFDLVVSTSVFTHLLPPDAERYLQEIARVLKKGGRCLITYFLWNDPSSENTRAGKTALEFRHELDGYRTTNKRTPEDAICFQEPDVRAWYAKNGLRLQEPLGYGAWSGRERTLSYQDLLLGVKS